MKFEVTVLGCGSATPTLRHWPTSQLLNHEEHYFLFDCGEGTQLQLRRYGLKLQRINHIFITHLHGDHYLGLFGLLSTMHLLGRTNDLHIYAQEDLKAVTEMQLKISHSRLRFTIEWHFLTYEGETIIYENERVVVTSFPLKHRVPCCGFRFSEKPKERNIIPEYIEQYSIPIARIRQIKKGADYKLEDGTIIANDMLTRNPTPAKSFAFCTDTIFNESIIPFIIDVDLLYHESTFLEKDSERASFTFHTTARQAGIIAQKAGAKKLLLGHYSARYRELDPFRKEAEMEFPQVLLANEGETFEV